MLKKIFTILTLTIVLTTGAFARITRWRVQWVKANSKALQQNIQRSMRQRWIPVGLSGRRGKIFILYLKNPRNRLGITAWRLQSYKTFRVFNRKAAMLKRRRYIPYGFTYFRGRYWVFYIKTRIYSPKWMLSRVAASRTGIRKKIESLRRRGLFPSGLTFHRGRALILSIKDPTAHKISWIIRQHSNKVRIFKRQVTTMIKRGWIPYTFSYKGNKIIIFYWKRKRTSI